MVCRKGWRAMVEVGKFVDGLKAAGVGLFVDETDDEST